MGYRGRNPSRGSRGKIRTYCENDISTDGIKRPFKTKRLTNNSLDSVSLYSPFELSVNTDPDSVIPQIIGNIDQRKPLTTMSLPLPVNLIKLLPLAKQSGFLEFIPRQDYQAESRLRPFARRAFKIARPARVDIRARNPWVRLRFILLG